MSASQYFGRIGALAVALGLGAALTTGTGIAWATPAGSGQSTTASEHQAERPSAGINIAKKIRDARAAAGDTGSANTAPTKRRNLVPGGALKRASEVAEQVQKDVDKTVDRVTEKITDATKGMAFDRTPARLNDYSPPPGGRTPLADRVPSLRASTAGINAAVQAAVEDISQTGVRAVRGVAPRPVVRGTFAAPAVADINAAIASMTAQFTMNGNEAVVEVAKAPQLVSSLLSVVGLAPLAANSPLAPAPVPQPALLALMAWARREFESSFNPSGPAVQTMALAEPVAALVVDPNLQTPKPTMPVVGKTMRLPLVTGPLITTAPYGQPGNYGIAGTDLGIMWDDGAGHVLMIFGDTFDQPNMTGVWRSNVLLRTVDTNLSNGIQIQDAVISPGNDYSQNTWSSNFGATQVIRDPGFLGVAGSTTTIIPTAAISVTEDGKTTQYVNVMSVRTWDTPGRWTTNWSAIAYSEDGGKSWTVDPNTVRSSGWLRASARYVPGNQNFQQGAFVMGQEDDVNADGERYVYSFGTPSGRGGSAYVSRVPQDEIRNLSAYEYWAGDDRGWVANDPSAAVPVIGATGGTGAKQQTGILGWISRTIHDILGGIVVGGLTGGNVSEMSMQYNEYLDKYVVLYTDGGNNVVMRVSDSPQGQWSDATVLVKNNTNPALGEVNTGMYAPMIHPWSGTDALGAGNEQYLYYNLSYWDEYNVRTMQTDLSPMASAADTNSGTIAV